jgi:hypothetical protein
LIAVGLVAVAFVGQVALPYFSLTPERLGPYWPRRWWLIAHVATGIVALLSGPVQLWLGITLRWPALHRRLGLVYIASVLVGALAAYGLVVQTSFGWVFGAGLAGLATAWLLTTGLAFVAIRRHLIDQHREWMIRSYVVTTAFLTFRILMPWLGAAGIGVAAERAAMTSWFCWAVPLLITEAVLQGRKVLRVRAV